MIFSLIKMVSIDNISNDASQITVPVLSDGTRITLTLNYLPTIQRWGMEIAYGDFSVKSIILCNHPNIMRSWRNLIPFGIGCSTLDGADPFNIDDFSSGRATLYVLDSTDVSNIEDKIALQAS